MHRYNHGIRVSLHRTLDRSWLWVWMPPMVIWARNLLSTSSANFPIYRVSINRHLWPQDVNAFIAHSTGSFFSLAHTYIGRSILYRMFLDGVTRFYVAGSSSQTCRHLPSLYSPPSLWFSRIKNMSFSTTSSSIQMYIWRCFIYDDEKISRHFQAG